MKKVLVIAYYFPPLGGAGVQRTLRFVKYLSEFGWMPTIVTVKDNKYYVKDESLLNNIPSEVEIISIPGFEFLNYYYRLKKYKLHKISSFLDKITAIPDRQIFWCVNVRKNLPKMIDIKSFDLIYATYGPGSNLLAGLWFKKKYHLPFVIDFRDDWSNHPQIKGNMWLRIKQPIFRKFEQECVNSSEKTICLNEKMKQNFIMKYPNKDKSKFVTISNGYDQNDFIKIKKMQNTVFPTEKFNIVYSGSFYGFQNPKKFIKAIKTLIKEKPSYLAGLQIHFIGNVQTKEVKKYMKEESLKTIIKLVPYMHHDKLLQYLHCADLLLLIIGESPGAEVIYTGKLFEYIAINKPILAIVPPNGAAAEVIDRTNSGFVVDHSSIQDIQKMIEFLYQQWKRKEIDVKQNTELVMEYSASNTCKKLADVFNDLTDH